MSLGYTNISVVSKHGEQSADFNFPVYKSLLKALQSNQFEVAIIANPTADHLSTVKCVLKAGIKSIYLEKPISNSLQGIEEISVFVKDKDINLKIGYDLHFDPGLEKIKELLGNEVIGKVVSVNAQVGQYLPDWRPQQDYRKGMSARLSTGGGVMLDLIHEFDYLYCLFGPVETVASFYNNSGALEIETEDVAEVLLRFKSGVVGTIHLDYLQRELVRNCMITGYEGSIFWNLRECKVEYTNSQKQKEVFEYKNFDRNDRFIAIMKAFLSNSTDCRLTTFDEGLESLKMVIAAKHSCDQNTFVSLDQFTKTLQN